MNIDNIIAKSKQITDLEARLKHNHDWLRNYSFRPDKSERFIQGWAMVCPYRGKIQTGGSSFNDLAFVKGSDTILQPEDMHRLADALTVRYNQFIDDVLRKERDKINRLKLELTGEITPAITSGAPVPFAVTVNPFDQQIKFECAYGVQTASYEDLDEWGNIEYLYGVDHKSFDFHVLHDEEFRVYVYPVVNDTPRYDNSCDVTLNLTTKPL